MGWRLTILMGWLCIACVTSIQAQNWLWAKQPVFTGNPASQSNGEGIAVVTDAQGNNYQTGFFAYASMRYGSTTLSTVSPCMFLVKRDATGNVLWARQTVSGTLSDLTQATAITMDPAGNLYITGLLRGTATFGPYTVTSQFGGEVFVVKYDTNGNVIWVRTSAMDAFSGYQNMGYSIASDHANHLYVTGEFHNTTIFGEDTLRTPGPGEGSVFIAKYDTNGNVIWARQADIPSKKSSGRGKGITVDSFDNVYLTGSFRDSITFGNTPMLVCTSKVADIFVAKYDANGNALWARQSHNNSQEYWSNGPIAGNGITTDRAGNVYIAGNFEDTLYFGSATLINTVPFSASFPYGDMMVAKLDADGNVLWAKAGEPETNASYCGWSIVSDAYDRIYFLGTGFNFNGGKQKYHIKFSNQVFIMGQNSVECSMLLQMDVDGNVQCGSIVPVGGDDYCTVSVDPQGKYIYLSSDQYLQYNVTIGPDVLSTQSNPVDQGVEIPYVLRWELCSLLPALAVNKTDIPCADSCTGTATAVVTSGTPPYSYVWNTGQTTAGITALCAGAYQVTITDNAGKVDSATVNIIKINTGTGSVAGTLAATDDTLCAGSIATLSTTGSTGSLQWQYAPAGSGFATLLNAIDTFYTAALTQTTTYRVIAGTGGCADTSNTVVVTAVPAPPAPLLTATDTLICPGDSAQICATGGPYTAYNWNNTAVSTCIAAKSAGAYWVTVTDVNECTASSGRVYLQTYPASSVSIIVNGDTLTSFNAASYQWYLDDTPITGATQPVYVANGPGLYSVQITDNNGCIVRSSPVVIAGVEPLAEEEIIVYPNPSQGQWMLKVDNHLLNARLEIYTTDGRLVYQATIKNTTSEINFEAARGIYLLRIATTQGELTKKLVRW